LTKITYVAAIVNIKAPQFIRVLQSDTNIHLLNSVLYLEEEEEESCYWFCIQILLLTIIIYTYAVLPVLITNKNNHCFMKWDENERNY